MTTTLTPLHRCPCGGILPRHRSFCRVSHMPDPALAATAALAETKAVAEKRLVREVDDTRAFELFQAVHKRLGHGCVTRVSFVDQRRMAWLEIARAFEARKPNPPGNVDETAFGLFCEIHGKLVDGVPRTIEEFNRYEGRSRAWREIARMFYPVLMEAPAPAADASPDAVKALEVVHQAQKRAGLRPDPCTCSDPFVVDQSCPWRDTPSHARRR